MPIALLQPLPQKNTQVDICICDDDECNESCDCEYGHCSDPNTTPAPNTNTTTTTPSGGGGGGAASAAVTASLVMAATVIVKIVT